MIDKRIEYYEKEIARLFDLTYKDCKDSELKLYTQTISEHEAVLRELRYIKKCNAVSLINNK